MVERPSSALSYCMATPPIPTPSDASASPGSAPAGAAPALGEDLNAGVDALIADAQAAAVAEEAAAPTLGAANVETGEPAVVATIGGATESEPVTSAAPSASEAPVPGDAPTEVEVDAMLADAQAKAAEIGAAAESGAALGAELESALAEAAAKVAVTAGADMAGAEPTAVADGAVEQPPGVAAALADAASAPVVAESAASAPAAPGQPVSETAVEIPEKVAPTAEASAAIQSLDTELSGEEDKPAAAEAPVDHGPDTAAVEQVVAEA
ncbi:MAG TPA: hypothetical protein VG797_05660, partial [Phycisphaerales bacterium]|nr:hypothetical protein [Phycisphaerales bacterium]